MLPDLKPTHNFTLSAPNIQPQAATNGHITIHTKFKMRLISTTFSLSQLVLVQSYCSVHQLSVIICVNSFRPETHYPHVTWSHVMLNTCSLDVRGDLTLNSMAHIHTSVTLPTSRDLAWSSGRLTCQHTSQISSVAHISCDVTYVSSALQTLPVVSRNGGNAYWKSAPTDLFIWHQVTRL